METTIISTNIGNIAIFCQKGNIIKLELNAAKEYNENNEYVISQTAKQLREYLDGNRKIFDIPILVEGSEFEKEVLHAILSIEYGKTISYSELASRAGYPKAVRAAASVCRKNKIPILIPCHRVIKSNGELGSYSGGEWLKKHLLVLENINKTN